MSLNHAPCTDPHGTISYCHFLPHNDGVTPNPISAWDAWVAACRPDPNNPTETGAIMRFCRGNPFFVAPEGLKIPYAYRYILQGDGQEVSVLSIDTGPNNDSLWLEGAAAMRIQGLSVIGYGNPRAVLKLFMWSDDHPADRNQIVDVTVIARDRVTQGALVLYNCSDVVIDRCRLLNYSEYFPSPTLMSHGGGGLHVTGHTEIHSFVLGADVISLEGASRFTMDSGLIGSNPPPDPSTKGRSYIGISGPVQGIAITGGQLYSDNGKPPDYAFYQQPGSHLDGVRIGCEVTIDTSGDLIGGSPSVGPAMDITARWLGRPASAIADAITRAR